MSKLYGTLNSDTLKTPRNCQAHHIVSATARSWSGSVQVQITSWLDEEPRVSITVGDGSTANPVHELWSGLLSLLLQGDHFLLVGRDKEV